MRQVNNLSDAANQVSKITLDDGSILVLTIIYRPAIQRWSMQLSHPAIPPGGEIEELNLCIHPNLLRMHRNIIPFGIACVTTDGADPVYIEDFSNGRAIIYILNSSEVQQVEVDFFGFLV